MTFVLRATGTPALASATLTVRENGVETAPRADVPIHVEAVNKLIATGLRLNDTQFVEAARNLAQRVLKSEGSSDHTSKLNVMSMRLLSRPFNSRELVVVRNSLDQLISYYNSHPDDARKLLAEGESKADPSIEPETLAAWTMLANELMNLDEVLNK